MKLCGTTIIGLLLIMLVSAAQSQAVIVTDNNVQAIGLGDLTNSFNATATENFTATDQLVALQANVNLTAGPPFPVNAYIVDRFGTAQDVSNFVGNDTYSQAHTLVQGVTGTSAITYSLNVGLPPAMYGYTFSATNVKANVAAGADYGLIPGTGGNIVPNASFEDPSLNYFSGGSIVSDPGVQGSHVFQNLSTGDALLSLPVIPGVKYDYSFWYKLDGANNYAGLEYGFSVPVSGFGAAPGNTEVLRIGSTSPWTEITGTFTPTVGQTHFYLSGFNNSGVTGAEFDSIFVAEAPEPSTILLLGLGSLLAIRRRTHPSRA